MAPYKRKFDELDDSDSDEPAFGKQILPVANLPDDFEGEPMDGMQYLFTVRRDAKSLPHVIRVANPYETAESSSFTKPKSTGQTPHSALPSIEWRTMVELRWKNIRKNFNQPTVGTSSSQSSKHGRLMPEKKERDLWWDFLSGKPEHVWNRTAKISKKELVNEGRRRQPERGMRAWEDFEQHEEEEHDSLEDSHLTEEAKEEVEALVENKSLPTPSGTPAPPDDLGHSGSTTMINQKESIELELIPREPSPRLLKLIDERMALHLLMYITHWLNLHLGEPNSLDYLPTNTHARWIFSLLLRIDDYISADDMNLLRNLARACLAFAKISILQRTKGVSSDPREPEKKCIQGQKMDENACWIIISAIVGIWGQRDLWMDAEDALASIQ